ncbi:MAG TPA: hypothetical protein DCR93_18550, partial [Cytophagales bacterium]|nr:hypothetical protein [Cytophagales bacterium]
GAATANAGDCSVERPAKNTKVKILSKAVNLVVSFFIKMGVLVEPYTTDTISLFQDFTELLFVPFIYC